MVKLIVTDMDGSLLDSDKKLPSDFGVVYSRLQQIGIPLVVASGRSVMFLGEYLKEMPGIPACICDNGAFLIWDGNSVCIHAIPREKIHRLLDVCASISNIELMMCGVHGTYCLPEPEDFFRRTSSIYADYQVVESLYTVDDTIFKIGVRDLLGVHTHAYPILQREVGNLLTLGVAHNTWMDITDEGINKGVGVRWLQERMGIPAEETMAFGDNYNDIFLLQNAHYSFAMANADPGVVKYANYKTKSNDESGVTWAIRHYLLNGV